MSRSAGVVCVFWVQALVAAGSRGGSWLQKTQAKNMLLLLPQPSEAGEQKQAGAQAGLKMLSGAFGRKGENEVIGLFKQLQ